MEHIKHFRTKGITTMIAAALFIVVIMGVNSYLYIRHDLEMAHSLMERELKIADSGIKWELYDIEAGITELEENARAHLHDPDKMYDIAHDMAIRSDFIKAVFIAFSPYYYPQKGRWFEPRCIRRDSSVLKEQGGGPHHDYFRQDWYKAASSNGRHGAIWTAPYTDHSQGNAVVMTLCSPLYDDNGRLAAVTGIDVSLQSLRDLLKNIEPYPGSICQLLDKEGRLIYSSAEGNLDEKKYFIDLTTISYSYTPSPYSTAPFSYLQVRLGIPKHAVYRPAIRQNTISMALILVGLGLLTLIMQRSLHNYEKLNLAQRRQQQVERELTIAHDIQMNMLRHDFPQTLHATLKPMKEVGGDLYDFCLYDDSLFFIIGDVAGKGLPAAMTMAGTVAAFRMAVRHHGTPVGIVQEINEVISERNPDLIFITAFVGKLNFRHGLLTYCNAGHNPPAVGNVLLDSDPDIPIGFRADYTYKEYGVLFGRGTRMVLYTDGITERRNNVGKFFGTDGLLEVISEHETDDLPGLTNAILQANGVFAADAEPVDDMTVMCIHNNSDAVSPTLTISNDVQEIKRVKGLLREYCQCMGCDHRTTRDVLLAVEEAVANVISHAYPAGVTGSIDMDVATGPAKVDGGQQELTIVITDAGKPFDPLAHENMDIEQAVFNRQVGGMGIYIYQQLMDNVSYQRTEEGRNQLTLSKIIKKKEYNTKQKVEL